MRLLPELRILCLVDHNHSAAADELYFSPADTMILTFDPFPVHVMVDDIDSIMGYNISESSGGRIVVDEAIAVDESSWGAVKSIYRQ